MHRTKLHSLDADKHWEMDRRDARRADARLSNGLSEIEGARQYHVNSMAKEQKRIQQDLMRIKQASSTKKPVSRSRTALPGNQKGSWAGLHKTALVRGPAPRTGLPGQRAPKQSSPSPSEPVAGSGSSTSLQTRLNDFMGTVSGRNFKPVSATLRFTKAEPSADDRDVADIKHSLAKRLSISEKPSGLEKTGSDKAEKESTVDSPEEASNDQAQGETMMAVTDGETPPKQVQPTHSAKQRRSSIAKEMLTFDEEVYAPDGYLRTMHSLPDFVESLEEAKKARYIRHRSNPEWNKELRVEEIFEQNKGLDPELPPDSNESSEGGH